MANLEVLRGTFDSFVRQHNLHSIWCDGLFGWDEERFDRKNQEAWAAFKKLTQDGTITLETGNQLEFLLRKACGLPIVKGLHFRKPVWAHGGRRFNPACTEGLSERAKRNHARRRAADERLREIMRAEREATNPPQPNA